MFNIKYFHYTTKIWPFVNLFNGTHRYLSLTFGLFPLFHKVFKAILFYRYSLQSQKFIRSAMNTSSCMFWICCSALRVMLTESRLCRLLFSCKTGGKIKHRSSVTLLSITLLQPSLSPIKSIQTSETPATVAQKTQVSLNQCGSHLWQPGPLMYFVIVIGRGPDMSLRSYHMNQPVQGSSFNRI